MTHTPDQIRAMPAGSELDDHAAALVMGWQVTGWTEKRRRYDYRDEVFEPSVNIAHAWELVELVMDPAFEYPRNFMIPPYTLFSYWFQHANLWSHSATEAAEAITRAAILAKMGER